MNETVLSEIERFVHNVIPEPNSGCWLWAGTPSARGYGAFTSTVMKGRSRAHRVSVWLFHGPFDLNLVVCHRCDNPSCVNPQHLFVGTQSDNLADAAKKGRLPMIANPTPWNRGIPACHRGHLFTPENTKLIGGDQKRRECRACKKINDAVCHSRRKERRAEARKLREGK